MLDADIQRRLNNAKANESSYRPNMQIRERLAEKTLAMFVGPVAAGKSFLMNQVVKSDSGFSRVPVFTTRNPRPDDESGMFRCIPHDNSHLNTLLGQIERCEVVQYVVHPTTGNIYGSTLEDYANKFNMLATLSSTVDLLRTLPFKNTVTIGLATNPETWKQRLNQRYPSHDAERAKRLVEAHTSLDWLLSQPDIKWIDTTSEISVARQSVINIVKYNQDGDPDACKVARAMRELLETGP